MERLLCIQTTVGSKEDAHVLIRSVLDHKWAACIQTWELDSHYVWKGVQANESEWMLQIKTTGSFA